MLIKLFDENIDRNGNKISKTALKANDGQTVPLTLNFMYDTKQGAVTLKYVDDCLYVDRDILDGLTLAPSYTIDEKGNMKIFEVSLMPK